MGREGAKERRGRESLSIAVPPPLLSPAGGDSGSPSTRSPSSSPPSPPTLSPERAEREPQPERGRGRRGGGGGGCVRVCEGRHLSLLRSQATAGGGASRSGSGGDSGGGFRSPAAKMLKVTVPSCSASSCSSVTASVAPATGSLVPDYWIDGSNRDALNDFFEVESELGR